LFHDQWQVEQLEDEHPAQEELPADLLVVCPPLPLLTKPHADIIRLTLALPQVGHLGLSLPMIRHSNFSSHLSQ